jgi:translation initiation factor 2 gamma subunit (eIF-2gamma)
MSTASEKQYLTTIEIRKLEIIIILQNKVELNKRDLDVGESEEYHSIHQMYVDLFPWDVL